MIVELNGFGKSDRLNLFVKAYKTENELLTATPSDGTIGIITTVEISSWTFSSSEPENPDYGMVWVSLSDNASSPINVVKENAIMIYPVSVSQYIDSTWVRKSAKTRIDGSWKDWITYLFYDGQVNEDFTGGINGTIQDGVIYFYSEVDPSYNQTYTTKNKVDLTNAHSVKAIINSPNTVGEIYFRLLVDDSAQTGARVLLANLVAYAHTYSPFNGESRMITLDVSSFSGEYYLGYAWGVDSNSENYRRITGKIERWWIE